LVEVVVRSRIAALVSSRMAGRYSAIAYAGGGHGKSSLAYDEVFLDELRIHFQAKALFYFGDLDPAGIRIGSRAAERRAERSGVPLQPSFWRCRGRAADESNPPPYPAHGQAMPISLFCEPVFPIVEPVFCMPKRKLGKHE
jgi:hypothetical protein